MSTYDPAAPPVHVTFTPWARLTEAIVDALDHVKAAGSVKVALKCCTSLPPEPLSNVNVPPAEGMKVAGVVLTEAHKIQQARLETTIVTGWKRSCWTGDGNRGAGV